MKRLLSILISLSILVVLYWKIDFSKLAPVFAGSDPWWMTLSLSMVIPLTLFTSWRLQQLMPRTVLLGFAEANRLILVASVLNLVLPSKMGDIAKAYFMRDRGHLPGSLALSLVVFEKACDMLSLLLWCVFGLVWIKVSGAVALEAFHPPEWLAWAGRESLFFWICALIVGGALGLGILLLGSQNFARFFFQLGTRWAPGKIGGSWKNSARRGAKCTRIFGKAKRVWPR